MALSAKLAMRQGQAMVLTPQLLQAIKLLQMPNAELAAFIENELERNPLLDRADDRPTPEAASADVEPPTPDMDVTAGDWASENLESDPAALAQNLGTEIENAFGPDRAATPAERAPADEGQSLSATSWTGLSGRGRQRFRSRHRGLPGRDGNLERAPHPAGDDRFGRSGRSADRAIPHRRGRRGGLFLRHARGNRGPAGRAPRSYRGRAGSVADARTDRRVCSKPRGVPRAAIDRTQPVRPGDARADRQFARPGQTRHGPAAQGLRRRRRGPRRHDRRDQAARSQARARIRRRPRAHRHSGRLRHRRARQRMARRTQ